MSTIKTRIKTPEDIVHLRKSGKILAQVLLELTKQAKPGVTTKELDTIARQMTKEAGGKPSFLGYDGFPAGLCVSINEEIVHGIPTERKLKEGDIVGLDYGVTYEGMITDAAVTVPVGEVSAEAKRLLKGTKTALDIGINTVRDGVRTGDIGAVIENSLAKSNLAVIYGLSGHGVGDAVHEDPLITNFGTPGTGPTLRAGMTIAIEPNVSISAHDYVIADDGWTCKTLDGSLSAQFEHTVLITPTGSEILTSL